MHLAFYLKKILFTIEINLDKISFSFRKGKCNSKYNRKALFFFKVTNKAQHNKSPSDLVFKRWSLVVGR